jgi:hypothetical protein
LEGALMLRQWEGGMKFVLEQIFYGMLVLLLVWGVLAFILNLDFLDNPWGFWLVAAGCGAALLLGMRSILRNPEEGWKGEPSFVVAVIAVLVLAILWDRPYFDTIGAPVLLFPIIFIGIPLGVGTTRTLKSEFRPLTKLDIAIGIASGIAGVTLILLALQSGKIPFVGFAKITTAHFPEYYFFPEQDPTRALACNLPGHIDDWCKNAKARDYLALLALPIQALQSLIFVVWDTLVFALSTFAMNWLLRTGLRQFSLLKH